MRTRAPARVDYYVDAEGNNGGNKHLTVEVCVPNTRKADGLVTDERRRRLNVEEFDTAVDQLFAAHLSDDYNSGFDVEGETASAEQAFERRSANEGEADSPLQYALEMKAKAAAAVAGIADPR